MAFTAGSALAHEAVSTGNSTTAKTWTYSPTKPSLVIAARGYVNDAAGIFPTSMTWGGQSVSRVAVATGYVGIGTQVEVAIYWANATTVAAMSGGAGTITYTTTLATDYKIGLGIIEIEEAADSIADSGIVDGAYSSRDITLTTVAGDICFMICAERGDQGGLTTASGMTDWDDLAAPASDLGEVNVNIDLKVATGTSTTVAIDGDGDELSCSIGVAFRQAVGGGGGGNLPLLHALGEAA